MDDLRFTSRVPLKKPTAARCFAAFAALALVPAVSWGQDRPLSEDEIVARGLERAGFDEMRAGREMVGEGESLRATAWDNPELSYQRDDLLGEGADVDTVLVTQRLDLSGRRGLRREAASLRVQGQLKHLEWARDLYTIEVREHFHALLYLQARVKSVEIWRQHLEHVRRIIEARLESGDASALELQRIESALALVASRRDEIIIDRARAWSRLDALVGGLPASPWPRIEGELLPEGEPAPEEGELTLRADVRGLELEQRSLEVEADAASRGWIPGVEVGLGYLRQSGGAGGGEDADGFSLVLGLSLPLFSSDQGESMSARGEARVLRARRERMVFRLESRARGTSDELRRRLELALAFRSALERAVGTARLAREAYEGDALALGELLSVYEHLHEVREQAAGLEWRARRAHLEALRLRGGRP